MPTALEFNAFRFYADDGDEDGSTALAAQDTNITADAAGSDFNFHLRVRIDETAGVDGDALDDFRFQYSKNEGGFLNIKRAISSPVNVTDDTGSFLTDFGGDTTNRSTEGISDPGGLTFLIGKQMEGAGAAVYQITNFHHTLDKFTEHVVAFTLLSADLVNGDTLDFQIQGLLASGTFTNNVVPRITIGGGGGADHDALADDVESASEVSTPAVTQVHALLADDAESAAEASIPTVGQTHVLLADDAESAAEVSKPSASESNTLLADDAESASEVSTPAVSQVHSLLADDAESAAEVSTPSLAQVHALFADDLDTLTEVSTPTLDGVVDEEAADTHDGKPHVFDVGQADREQAARDKIERDNKADLKRIVAEAMESFEPKSSPKVTKVQRGKIARVVRKQVDTEGLRQSFAEIRAEVQRQAFAAEEVRIAQFEDDDITVLLLAA